MTTKRPSDLVFGNNGLVLDCVGPGETRLWLAGENVDLDRDGTRKLARGLQAILDYEEPSWVPEPGQLWRHKGYESVFVRNKLDEDVHTANNCFTSTYITGPLAGKRTHTNLNCIDLEPATLVEPIDPASTIR